VSPVTTLLNSIKLPHERIHNTITSDPAIPLLGICPKDTPPYHKDTCSTMFIAALFIIARNSKELTCPSTEEWTKSGAFT